MKQNFYSLCRNTEVRVETFLQRELYDLGLTPAQANLLLVISEDYPHGTTITQLHKCMGITKSSLSSLIKALRQKGYLCTTGHETDERIKVFKPTDKLIDDSKRLHSAEDRLRLAVQELVGEKEFTRMSETLQVICCKSAELSKKGADEE